MNYRDINDYELLYLVKDEDDHYKGVLFEKYYPVVRNLSYQYFYQYQSIIDEYDDLYQEGIIGLNYAIEKFDFQKDVSFYSYAILCIGSKLKDYIRKLKRNKNLIIKNAVSLSLEIGEDIFLEDIVASDDTTYHFILSKEQNDFLIYFKNNLSMKESLVFELRYNGFTYDEISKLLEIKKPNIYSYVGQIKIKFKNLHGSDCFF